MNVWTDMDGRERDSRADFFALNPTKYGANRLIYISHCIAGCVPRRHGPPLHDGLQQVQRPAVRRLVAERSQQAARHGARRLLVR